VEQVTDSFSKLLISAAKFLSIDLPAASIPPFRLYMNELKRWNSAINLTSIDDEKSIIIKHFADSMAALKLIDMTKNINALDVGSGAGFPALPLKIVRPDMSICLLEPNQKKSAFLRYMMGALRMDEVQVITRKLEDYATLPETKGIFDYVVVRAYNILGAGPLLGSLLADTGKLILYRSSRIEKDFKLSSLALHEEVEYELPDGYGRRVLSSFAKQTA
jgi:16S rRNA (guanine527-N7)-methyltransferase